MQLKHFTLIPLIILGMISCKSSSEKLEKLNLTPSGETLIFPLDSATSNISTGLVKFEDYFVNVNWKKNSLQFYKLTTQKLEREVYFEYEGPQGVGSLFGIHINSLDSIFLFPQIGTLVTLTDTTGQILNRIPYENPIGYANAFVHNAYFGSKPVISGDRIFVKTHIQGNYRAMTEEVLSTSQMAYNIHFSDSTTSFINLKYPEGYLSKGLKHFEPSLVFQPNFTVYSLFGDHRIFKQNKDGILETFDGKSQFLDESLPLFPVDGERFETQKYLMASSRYETLVFDEYRNVYYRFAYPTLAIEKEEDLLAIRENPGPFVIQVFDQEFKMITESYFEGGIYFPNNHFITEKGLYLSTNNPENPKAEEDAFRFELIELVD
jgi:hypothetical protein